MREYKEHIEEHCTSLGLGTSEAFDTRRLRELFVKEVSDNIEEYRDWMTTAVNGLEDDDFIYMKIHIFALRWRDDINRSSQLRTLLKLVVVNRT